MVFNSSYLLFAVILATILMLPNILHFLFGMMKKSKRQLAFKNFLTETIITVSLAVFLSVPLLWLTGNAANIYMFLITLVCLPFAIFEYAHIVLYKGVPNAAVYYSIFATNSGEAGEFLVKYVNLRFIGFIVLFAVVIGTVYWAMKGFSYNLTGPAGLLSILIPLVAIGLLFLKERKWTVMLDHTCFRVGASYYLYKKEIELLRKAVNQHHKRQFNTITRQPPHVEKEVYVFVIGESTNRHHIGLNGYVRDTTPLLNKIRHELYTFSDVISPNTHTEMALRKVLTFADDYNFEPFYTTGSLVEMFKQAGFKTYWISNQVVPKLFDTPLSILIQQTNEKYLSSTDGKNNKYDECLLPFLAKALKDAGDKKVIFMHIMGTHVRYTERYPASFDYFKNLELKYTNGLSKTQRETINRYDNAVRYNDYILASIISMLKELNEPTSMLYFSDHGEEVYDFRKFNGHTEVLASKHMFDIPFILWLNDAYKKMRPSWVKDLENYTHRPYSTVDLIHAIQDLCNIYTEHYNSSKNIFSKDFLQGERLAGNNTYDSWLTALH